MSHTNVVHSHNPSAGDGSERTAARSISQLKASNLGRHALTGAANPVHENPLPSQPLPQTLSLDKIKSPKFGINFVPAVLVLLVAGIVLSVFGVTHYNSAYSKKSDSSEAQKQPALKPSSSSRTGLTPTKSPQQTPTASQQKQTPVQKTPAVTAPQKTQPTGTLPTSTYVGSLPSSVSVYNTGNWTYYYAGGRQYVSAAGVSAILTQHQPSVPQPGAAQNHSLMELAVQSADGKQVVEVGWIVDPILNGDALPHIFVYHWVSGQVSCYNGCGFVRSSSPVGPGSVVAPGASGTYAIAYTGGNWNISYNGTSLGYYPGSLWGGTFTQVGYTQVFGEVEVTNNSTTRCVQMGNGLVGSNASSASISNYTLIGSATVPALSPFATAGSPFSYGFAGPTGLHLGGQGFC